jgi:hypothetical protein
MTCHKIFINGVGSITRRRELRRTNCTSPEFGDLRAISSCYNALRVLERIQNLQRRWILTGFVQNEKAGIVRRQSVVEKSGY